MFRKGPFSVLVACLVALGSNALHATTLNMSHDLVLLGIASQNMVPNEPALDARPLFDAAIQYIQEGNPVDVLTVDPGNYYLLTPQQSSAVLVIALNNMTIDLAGSTFYFVGPLLPNGIELYYCTGLTLTNFNIDYLNPPYTHVKLVSVNAPNPGSDPTTALLKYDLLPGWPDPAVFDNLQSPFGGSIYGTSGSGFYAAFFRNGSIVPGTTRTLLYETFPNQTIDVIDPSPWGQIATLETLKPGDTVVVTTRGGGPPILVWESNQVTLSNINIYGSPTWAIQLFQTSNSTVDHVSVVPRPGTGLIGSDADGIHFIPTGPNNHIRNCTVRSTMDDALIMGDPYLGIVQQQPASNQLVVTRDGYIRFANGTFVNFVFPNTTLATSGGTIVSQDPPDSAFPEYNGQVTLTFSSNLPTLAQGTIVAFGAEAEDGWGSSIEDNLVEDTYGGRGIWIAGANGITVQRNVLRHTSMGGVVVEQETDEAVDPGDVGPPSFNIVITDNAFEGVLGPAACGTGIVDCLGAVEVESSDDQEFGFSASASNSDIDIANNYIADSGRSGIWIGELAGGWLENNLVIRSSKLPTLGGTYGIPAPFVQQVTEDALVPISIQYSTGITETGNTVEANSNIQAPVTMPANMTVPAAAARYNIAVSTAVPGFAWKAQSDSPWLFALGSGEEGSGTEEFLVTANNSVPARVGHITIAGQVLTVTQQGLKAKPLHASR